VRSLADETGITKSSVHRSSDLGAAAASYSILQVPLTLSSSRKWRDIVGLVSEPAAERAGSVLDEESQIQALERSQPILPLGLGMSRA